MYGVKGGTRKDLERVWRKGCGVEKEEETEVESRWGVLRKTRGVKRGMEGP